MTKTKHTALYRTYRPASFKDVQGQEQVVEVLEAAIAKKSIAHAYLFAGTRGTGKTTIARIFASEIGCTSKDLYEIDAASNRGIDDIRELREGVHTMPFESPYKVYIIDEAHMLTTPAWNALLKTLEEPPSHVIFILATTEKHKVPDTIQSRCDVYTFKQPTRELIADHVAKIAKKEKYTLERSAADLIALLAEGSFRDALGILQKVLTISKDKKVDVAEVERVTGAPTSALVMQVVEALAKNDSSEALSAIKTATESNMDMRIFAKLIMHRIRIALLLRHAPDLKKDLQDELTKDDFARVEEIAKEKDANINADTLRILLESYSTMAYAAVPALPLELAVIDLTFVKEQEK